MVLLRILVVEKYMTLHCGPGLTTAKCVALCAMDLRENQELKVELYRWCMCTVLCSLFCPSSVTIGVLSLTLSAPNMTKDVLLYSPKWYLYFPYKEFGKILLFILDSIKCAIFLIFSHQNNLFCINIVRRKWLLINLQGLEGLCCIPKHSLKQIFNHSYLHWLFLNKHDNIKTFTSSKFRQKKHLA